MTIGVYSGSFDPIHTGHAMVANYVGQWSGVDEVWIMVSRQNPLKSGMMPEADHHRMRMAELVANKCANVKASDFELSLPLPSYTYVTLCKLREAYPEHKFKLIIGSDNWLNLGRWRDADKIIKEFGLVIYPRPCYVTPLQPPKGVEVLSKGPAAHVSASFVREMVASGGNINYFVPVEVAEYINTHNLYRMSDDN